MVQLIRLNLPNPSNDAHRFQTNAKNPANPALIQR